MEAQFSDLLFVIIFSPTSLSHTAFMLVTVKGEMVLRCTTFVLRFMQVLQSDRHSGYDNLRYRTSRHGV